MKTIVGLFKDFAEADAAIAAIKELGYTDADFSVVAHKAKAKSLEALDGEGINRDSILLAATIREGDFGVVRDIMKEERATDVHARAVAHVRVR